MPSNFLNGFSGLTLEILISFFSKSNIYFSHKYAALGKDFFICKLWSRNKD